MASLSQGIPAPLHLCADPCYARYSKLAVSQTLVCTPPLLLQRKYAVGVQASKCKAVIAPPEQASPHQRDGSSGGTLHAGLWNCRKYQQRTVSYLAMVTYPSIHTSAHSVLYGAAKTAGQSHSSALQLSRQTLQRLEVASGMHVLLFKLVDAQHFTPLLAMCVRCDFGPWTIFQASWRDGNVCLQGELDAGQSIAALRRFSDNLAKLPENGWRTQPGHHLCPISHDTASHHIACIPCLICTA